jgi:anti-sigma B factor antagonist
VSAEQHPSDVPLTVSVERLSAATSVVRPVGDVDTATAGQVRGAVEGEVAAGAQHVVLDCTGVAFMGSAGLALLVEQREAAERREGTLRLVALPRAVSRPLQVTGLLELFEVHDDLGSATPGS